MSGEKNHNFGKTGELAWMFGKTGNKHPMFGKRHSSKCLQQMHEARLGENNINALLKIHDPPIIRELYADGYTAQQLAIIYNVSNACIYNIVLNRSWKIDPAEIAKLKEIRRNNILLKKLNK